MLCPECKSFMIGKENNGKKIMACSKCGYATSSEKNSDKQTKKDERIHGVAYEEDDANILPVTEVECPKCKHGEANFWEIQTRAGDEPPTKFLKCGKCKHTWRDYS